jgi:drug/metabolite transporter (DMT)-like permease
MLEALWIPVTVGAAFAQTIRNALQRGLTAEIGVVAGTHVRFLFGLPFALVFLAVATTLAGRPPPLPDAAAAAWIALGAVMQMAATALMLAAMRLRSFVVATAYTKTEPVLVLLVAVVALGEVPTPLLVLAVVTATAGVLIMTWPRTGGVLAGDAAKAAGFGVAAAGAFAVSAVAYRGGILALGGAGEPLAPATALAVAMVLQAGSLALWLAWRDPAALAAIARAWRPSLGAGFAGALASLGWFTAFALMETAAVRTLGLVELVFAQALSRRLFQEVTSPREWLGLALLALGVGLVLNLG